MAMTARTSVLLEITRNSRTRTFPRETVGHTLTGENDIWTSQNIGAAAEALALNEVVTDGLWMLANRSSTAGEIIHLRYGTVGDDIIRIEPGDVQLVRLEWAGNTPHAIADAGTPLLEYWALDA